jgi:hypothetical protein
MFIRSLLIASFMAFPASFAMADVNAREPDPSKWLTEVYDLYAKAQKNEALQSKATVDLIFNRGSKALKALYKKDQACSRKSGGVCALDFDFVIDGQDFQIADVKVGPTQITGATAEVIVTFKNFDTPNVNTYHFIKEGGLWVVDDVENQSGKDKAFSIAKMISGFKP